MSRVKKKIHFFSNKQEQTSTSHCIVIGEVRSLSLYSQKILNNYQQPKPINPEKTIRLTSQITNMP